MATATADPITQQWPTALADIKDKLCAKAAVTGPSEWDDEADEYSPCEPAAEIARLLIQAKVHPDLGPLKIAFVWRKDPKSDGEQVWGKCSTVGKKWRRLSQWDAIIEVNWMVWKNLSERQRVALIDHELCHLMVDLDATTCAVKLVPHDVEEFVEIAYRWGKWTTNLGQLVEATQQLELGI